MEKNITVGLYGINGAFNYGCEAIVRGTEIILNNGFDDLNIKYASLNPKEDRKRLKGCDVEIIPRKIHKLWHPGRINGISAYHTGFYLNSLYREDLNWIDDCDVIFSIGGDNYAIPANFQESKYKKYYSEYVHFGEIVKDKGKKLVIWGGSIGPFEEIKGAKKVFTNHLKHVDLITSRESKTTSYLKNSLNIYENVSEFPDPAFAIPLTSENSNNSKLTIGINLSPFSSLYAFGQGYSDKILQSHVNIIEMLIKSFDANILLIPHVISSQVINNDLNYLKIINDMLSDDIKDRVKLINGDLGFLKTKDILVSCDLVIAARMHCAINAISAGVPTLFVAYSPKAYGMVEYVYGNGKWLINLENFNWNNLETLIRKMISEKDFLKKFLNKRKEELRKNSYLAANEVKKLL